MLTIEVIEKRKIPIGILDELGSAFIVEIGRIVDGRSCLKMAFHITVEFLSIKKSSKHIWLKRRSFPLLFKNLFHHLRYNAEILIKIIDKKQR